MASRQVAQKVDWNSTSTGATSAVDFGGSMVTRAAMVFASNSTKDVVFRLQGSMGGSAIWYNLNAAATTSTGTAAPVLSTSGTAFDKVRVSISANATTATPTMSFWLAGWNT